MANGNENPEEVDRANQETQKGTSLKVPIKVIPKSLRPEVARKMVDAILKTYDTFEVLVILRQLRDVADEAAKQLCEDVINKFPSSEKQVIRMGATIELRGGKKDWEYDDLEITRLETEVKAKNTELKERQKFLQGLRTDYQQLDDSTGEIKTVHKAKMQNSPLNVVVTFPE